MTREWTRRGLLAACGASLAAGAGGGAAETEQCSATIATNALTEDGEPKLEVPSAVGVGIPIHTTCHEGAELEVELRSTSDREIFLYSPTATVGPQGRAVATVDLTEIDVGSPFEVFIFRSDRDSHPQIGELAHAEVVDEPPGEPAAIDGTAPRDPDGDGLYEDLNGNGETDYADVVQFYEHRDDPAVARRVDAYDFDLDGDVDVDDVARVFESV
ncbi:BGTF surface domain-containing protein [Halomicrobium salinisoli]|uniref:BGTF surface domain-containing protein n=1 Tax=Halomicrobium salinisoli TaxID=2878391 RepID=UPI001CF02019|nr:BGTF surface domain-containing protein [Halomicrobium salinisoli]